jgi:aspartyl-tRNA(Asn)/glutamyl-tRNA(Gln) amidotransferase subunit C
MNIEVSEVKYIAKLARLSFKEEEMERLTLEFGTILQHFHSLDKLELNDIDLLLFDESEKQSLRLDESKVFGNKTALFSNVKSMREEYIKVPKIIE